MWAVARAVAFAARSVDWFAAGGNGAAAVPWPPRGRQRKPLIQFSLKGANDIEVLVVMVPMAAMTVV